MIDYQIVSPLFEASSLYWWNGKVFRHCCIVERLPKNKHTPLSFTWHHTERVTQSNGKFYGVKQLVESAAHSAARHSGGVSIYQNLTGKLYK